MQQLLYKGFTQDANIRSFEFERTVHGNAVRTSRIEVVVKADLALLSRSRVAVQDGPALCLQILTSLLDESGQKPPERFVHVVTAEEATAFAGLKSLKVGTPLHRKRKPPKPTSASQLRWPRP